jgi:hypothetical protein
MTIRQKLEILASERHTPCVTISLNTHKTHPDNAKDEIILKKLLKEAEERVINEFGKRSVESLLDKLSTIRSEIDLNYNLNSLHIYLSNDTKEIIKSDLPVNNNEVHISGTFAVRPLIHAYSRSATYLIMLLSQGGVQLYEAINDSIVSEIKNDDFPFPENPHYVTEPVKRSDSKLMDNNVREFLNNVDKAMVKVHHDTGLSCVIISTDDNYSRLMQVADKPDLYHGYANIDYNQTEEHHIAKQGWEIIKEVQQKMRMEALDEINDAIAQGKVLTDLQEIYQAAIDGRGDLLMFHQDFAQPVHMTSTRTFKLVSDKTQAEVIDDITSNIAWEVLSKKGRVVITKREEIKDLGQIILKTRY